MARNFLGVSREELQITLLDAAALGQLSVLKKIAEILDKGDGIRKTMEITKDADGLGVFHIAASYGRTDICRYLIEELGFDPDFRSDEGKTPLIYAAREGKTGTLIYLCNCGADPTCTDRKGETPLHNAAQWGHGKSVQFLLSKEVPVDPESYRGTPLHVAARNGFKKAVKILLEHNADINKVSYEFFTPLLMSIFGNSLDCAKLLCKAGADVNLYCPLAIAISVHSAETVKCLLEAGANPNIPCELELNEYGMLPIEIAAECGEKRFVEMLLPLTSQLPTVPNWTVEGIMNYVMSPAFKKKHEIRRKKKFVELKVKGEQAFRKKEYLAAINFYTAEAQMAQGLRPNWPKAYYRVGAAFMLLKKYEEASQVLLDGFKLDPANKDMEKALLEALDCMKKSNAV
ncbi:uncharacterized protein LOC144544555 isoform X2 [Carex rostrata]